MKDLKSFTFCLCVTKHFSFGTEYMKMDCRTERKFGIGTGQDETRRIQTY